MLSGAALVLALELVLQNPAAAGPMPGTAAPGGAEAPEEREDPSPAGLRRRPELQASDPARSGVAGGADAAAAQEMAGQLWGEGGGGHGLFGLPAPALQRFGLAGFVSPPDAGEAAVPVAAGWPGLPSSGTRLATPPRAGIPPVAEGAIPEEGNPAAVVPSTTPSVPPPPPPPLLMLRVERSDALAARSVDGIAVLEHRGEQSGLTASRLAFPASGKRLLQLDSLRRFNGLALSRLDEARVNLQGDHRAIDASLIVGSAGSGSTAIQAADSLALTLSGSGVRRMQLVDSVVGLRHSTLLDPGGNDRIAIRASLELRLAVSAPLLPIEAAVPAGELRSTALQTSSLLLGDGADRVTIRSLVHAALAPSPLADSLPAALTPGEGIGLLERAVGLSGSLLDSGGGHDRVWIEASGREAVALEDAQVLLGEGNDALSLVGDVLRSRLEGGAGRNRIDVQGRVRDSSIGLDREGHTSVGLSAASDSLTVEGSGGLNLNAAAGDDHLTVQGPAWGQIAGGPGADRLVFTPLAGRADHHRLNLHGGEGRDLFVLAGLDPWLRDPAAAPPPQALRPASTRLLDLRLLRTGNGSLQLSDGLALQQGGLLSSGPSAAEPDLLELTPSGLEGLGDGKRLPIAPLASLLAGIGDRPPQLAIATAAAGSELVLLRPGNASLNLALLPALHAGDSGAPSPPPLV